MVLVMVGGVLNQADGNGDGPLGMAGAGVLGPRPHAGCRPGRGGWGDHRRRDGVDLGRKIDVAVQITAHVAEPGDIFAGGVVADGQGGVGCNQVVLDGQPGMAIRGGIGAAAHRKAELQPHAPTD